MITEVKEENSLYKVIIDKPIHIREIIKFILLMILIFILIGLIMIAKNSIAIIKEYRVYEQYEAQLVALQKQEEERVAQIERKRQEKIPKLTQEREKQFRKYLSFRKEKSIFNV